MRIFQDRYGFMWFATLDGLNRYDGYRFTVFRHDPRDSASLTESYVQTFFEDSKGRLWIGTISGGLDLFDRVTETFVHVKDKDGKTEALSNGPISAITEDRQGRIWVQANQQIQLVTVDDKKAGDRRFSIRTVSVPFPSGSHNLFGTKSRSIYQVNAREGIVYKLTDETIPTWSVFFRQGSSAAKKKKQLPTKPVLQLLEDSSKRKLYILHENGVSLLDEKTGSIDRQFQNDFFTNTFSPLQPSLDRNGLIWFLRMDSLFFFNTNTGKVESAVASDASLQVASTHCYSTYVDQSGLLWVGTNGFGILKRNARAEAFHHTGYTSFYTINEAPNGEILFGVSVSSGMMYDRKTKTLASLPSLVRSEQESAYYSRYLAPPIATDAAGTWRAEDVSLYFMPHKGQQVKKYDVPLPNSKDYPDFIQTGLDDSNGHIWLGTTQGLARFGKNDKSWAVYRNDPGNRESLSSNRIFCLIFDPVQPRKYLWIGTDGGGLNRMDLATGKCIVYRTKDGLPNDVIYGILPDDEGNLWMSTNKGLSCFNPVKQTFRNFDYKDGLQSNEFNRRSYYRTKDGCLFFGGVKGFNYFFPAEIGKNQAVPKVVITGFEIRNKPVPIATQASPLQSAIYLTKNITLPYEQNFVSFEFAAMDFVNPEKNNYRYKLEGLDKDWIDGGTNNSATYTNLDPGTYTFLVKGSNNDGAWNDTPTSLQLTILPPWYMTWWFRTAIVFSVLLSVWLGYRYRLAQSLKLHAMRDRIAGDLHDEVGSNLSNIYIFSNVAQEKAIAKNETTAPLLQKITDYTQISMEAMHDIVWMINTRNDRFENIMVRMRTLAAEISESLQCRLHLAFDEKLTTVKLNMEDRKNLYLIYKEALTNMAKHADCATLWVEMKLVRHAVTLTIRDDGKGFDPTSTSKGNGLFNMKNRAALLKGTLTLTSAEGEGTRLQLRFKV